MSHPPTIPSTSTTVHFLNSSPTNESAELCGMKIVGTYSDYVCLMKDKDEANGFSIENENIIVMDSYDGAEHSMTASKRKKCGIIQLLSIFGENCPGG
eukprot:scaffold138900_cov52-Attheya_sp.AAC.4